MLYSEAILNSHIDKLEAELRELRERLAKLSEEWRARDDGIYGQAWSLAANELDAAKAGKE